MNGGISYRPCRRSDAAQVAEVIFRTGYMGEDLEGRFGDVRLFGLIFGLYYVYHETDNCFVTVDDGSGRVVGYIIGTRDALGYGRRFARRMMWRIASRLIFWTSWRHPKDIAEVLYWKRHDDPASAVAPDGYEAHLHINLLPGYQRLGIGGELMRRFEERLSSAGVDGVYLHTSNHNAKAIPFYIKHGFSLLEDHAQPFWRGVDDHRTLVFGKRLQKMPSEDVIGATGIDERTGDDDT